MSLENLQDFDNFYYYTLGDQKTEIESDIQQIVAQNDRSLFYNRSNDAAGLDKYENMPNAVSVAVLIPYSITSAISKRNSFVGDGQISDKDYRVMVSQSSIKVKNSGNKIDISMFYIPLYNLSSIEKTEASITGG